jgi:hypothetical protein
MNKCLICSKETKNKKYCSHKCYSLNLKNNIGEKHPRYSGLGIGTKYICINCEKENLRTRGKQKYCNVSCQVKYEYKTGKRDKFKNTENSHKFILDRSREKFEDGTYHKWLGKRGYYIICFEGKRKPEHHYIWEKVNGPIPKGYAVHHIDFNKLNNNLENLELLTHSEHSKKHYLQRNINKESGRLI